MVEQLQCAIGFSWRGEIRDAIVHLAFRFGPSFLEKKDCLGAAPGVVNCRTGAPSEPLLLAAMCTGPPGNISSSKRT